MIEAQDISARYDKASATYGAAPDDPRRRLYWLAYEHLTFRAVGARLPADRRARVLDAGGGGGKYGAMIAERGHDVTVLDLSPGMVAEARRRFKDKGLGGAFIEGNILSLPFPDASFDFVLCEGDPVSYCLDDHPRALAELVRVARPGAPVILGVDSRYAHFVAPLRSGNQAAALDALLTGRGTCPYGLPVHAFTPSEIRAAVEAAGAEVEELTGKPVLFSEILEAMAAARGPDFDPWACRDEVLAIQERLAREGFAACGGHLQVVARRR